jgi:hypothetical protein
VYDENFKIMIVSFIQSGLNMMVYMSNRSKSIYDSTFVGPSSSSSISKGKISLLSDDLL